MANRIEELNYVPETSEKTRNIAIVGAGGIVSGSHPPVYRMAGYPVVGIYDLDHKKAEKAAKELGIPNVVPELEQLIELGVREDAVFDIAVPASKTASISRLLPDNAAVPMQKPMGESIEQAKEILDICHAKNLTVDVNFQLRQAPYTIAARKLIQDGVIGDIVDIDWRVVELHPWHLQSFLFGLERMEINYHNIHYIDYIRSFVGNPKDVCCKTMQHPKMQALSRTRTAITMDYGDTLHMNLHINHNHDYAPDYQESIMKIGGIKGAIHIQLGLILNYPTGRPDKVEYTTEDSKGWRELEVKESWFNEAFIGTTGGLMKKLEDLSYHYMNSVENAYHTMCVVEACYKSNEARGLNVDYAQ